LGKFGYSVVFATTYKEMTVIRPKLDGIEFQTETLGDPSKDPFTSFFNYCVLKDITPVLRRELKVVVRFSKAVLRTHGSVRIATANHGLSSCWRKQCVAAATRRRAARASSTTSASKEKESFVPIHLSLKRLRVLGTLRLNL
jgi:hypothetical protein